jgi:hypothetical protein
MPHLAGGRSPFPVLLSGLVAGAGGVLVRSDHRAIDVVAQPVQFPAGISAAVDLGQQPVEHSLAAPAVKRLATVFQEP